MIPNPLHLMFAWGLNKPKKRKRPKIGVGKPSQIRSLEHLRFVRSQPCPLRVWSICSGPIQACHVRTRTDGGAGSKPGDNFTLPLCAGHHATQHNMGEKAFEKAYNINMRKIADTLWARSPARAKIEREKEG